MSSAAACEAPGDSLGIGGKHLAQGKLLVYNGDVRKEAVEGAAEVLKPCAFMVNLRDALLDYIRAGEEWEAMRPPEGRITQAKIIEHMKPTKRFRAALDTLRERMEP